MLSPERAQEVVDQRIQEFGLDALPKVKVRVRLDGRWQVNWSGHQAILEPMPMARWRTWLEQNVGPLSPEHLATTEG